MTQIHCVSMTSCSKATDWKKTTCLYLTHSVEEKEKDSNDNTPDYCLSLMITPPFAHTKGQIGGHHHPSRECIVTCFLCAVLQFTVCFGVFLAWHRDACYTDRKKARIEGSPFAF